MSILVTGANRGLGLVVAQKLAAAGKSVIFAGRSAESVQQASSAYPNADFLELDISDSASVASLPEKLQQKGVSLSVLVNNAGILKPGWNEEDFRQTLQTNTFGTLSVIEAALPFIQQGGRVVNVSSQLGQLKNVPASYVEKVQQINSLDQLNEIRFDPQADVVNSFAPEYHVSKALLNRITQILAKDSRFTEKNIRVLSVCPGWCRTDMGTSRAMRSAEQGADSIIYSVENDQPTGTFTTDGKDIPY